MIDGKNLFNQPVKNDLRTTNCLLYYPCKIYVSSPFFFQRYKMNEIMNTFLLGGDKFMRGMHVRQSGFAYSACGPFIKNKDCSKLE